MSNILLCNAEKYEGQYVTTRDHDSKEVISHSKNASTAYKDAISKGYPSPVIMFVPSEYVSAFVY